MSHCMQTNQSCSQQKRKYFPIELPNGKIKYVRDRISFREKHKLNTTLNLCSERR